MGKSISIIPLLLVMTITVSCAPTSPRTVGNESVPGSTDPVPTPTTQTTQTEAEKPDSPEEPEIYFKRIEMNGDLDGERLQEITDQEILNKIAKMFPDSQTYLTKSSSGSGDIFQAIIPLEIDPNISKEIFDLIEGLINDPALIRKYADLFESDFSKITDQAKYIKGVRNYYILASAIALNFVFSEINMELETMAGDTQTIKGFQEKEFKSKIMSLHARVKEISTFTSEIVEKEEVRTRNLKILEDLKTAVMQLIDQVNLNITDNASGELSDFNEYEKIINAKAIFIDHQRILTNVLEEISNLMFVFNNGNQSTDFSFSTYKDYIKKSNEARADLSRWHDVQIEAFGVDLLSKKVNKYGVAGIISYIPGVFNKDWRKKELDDPFIEKIREQTKETAFVAEQPRAFSGDNVTIIIMGGKFYYFHPKKA